MHWLYLLASDLFKDLFRPETAADLHSRALTIRENVERVA